MKNTKTLFALAILSATALSACGESASDRALSGAGIGAGVGALGSSLSGGSPASGALWGGAAGAAVGGFTDSDDLNLGKPAWRK